MDVIHYREHQSKAVAQFLYALEDRIQYTTMEWPKTAAEYLADWLHSPAPELWKDFGGAFLLAALHLMG